MYLHGKFEGCKTNLNWVKAVEVALGVYEPENLCATGILRRPVSSGFYVVFSVIKHGVIEWA